MSIEGAVSAALERIEGASGGVYPMEALKGARAPFLFYEIESDEREETLRGDCALAVCRVRVHAVTERYGALPPLAQRCAAALRGMAGTEAEGVRVERVHVRQATPDLRESEVNLYRRAVEAEINYTEI